VNNMASRLKLYSKLYPLVLLIIVAVILYSAVTLLYAQISVSPPYGYITVAVENDELHYRNVSAKWYITTVDWWLNPSNLPQSLQTWLSLHNTDLVTELSEATAVWENEPSSNMPVLRYLGNTTTYEPLVEDHANVIGFLNIGSGIVLAVTLTCNDIRRADAIYELTEFDIAFNTQTDWLNYNFTFVALHEFGHTLGLGDIRNFSTVTEDQRQVMYGDYDITYNTRGTRDLQWGDRAGIRWLYPVIYGGFDLYPVYTIVGGDIAAMDIDGGLGPDVIFVWGEYDSTNDVTYIWGLPLWNLNNHGFPLTRGAFKLLAQTPGQVCDVGATLVRSIDDDTRAKLVITFTNETQAYYIVLFNIYRIDDGFEWNCVVGPYPVYGSWCDDGTNIEVIDLNGDGILDYVVMDTLNSL